VARPDQRVVVLRTSAEMRQFIDSVRSA
jgi:hypothetical protein